VSVDLRKFFIVDLKARIQPAGFMGNFFIPVLQAMDRIFNWKDGAEQNMVSQLIEWSWCRGSWWMCACEGLTLN
jgi:hypothetical protein